MKHEYQLCSDYFDIELIWQRPLNTSLIVRRDVITISLIGLLFLLTCHYNFGYRWYPFLCSVCITISCQFHVQHASRFCVNFMFSMHHDFARFWVLVVRIFVFAQTCPNSTSLKQWQTIHHIPGVTYNHINFSYK